MPDESVNSAEYLSSATNANRLCGVAWRPSLAPARHCPRCEEVANKATAASDGRQGGSADVTRPRGFRRRLLFSGLLRKAIHILLLGAFMHTNSFNSLGVLGL